MSKKLRRLCGFVLTLGAVFAATFLLPPMARSGAAAEIAAAPRLVTLSGQEARSFVEKYASHNRRFARAQARSAARLTGRGHLQTTTVVVQVVRQPHQSRPANLGNQLLQLAVPTLKAQNEYYETEEGTIIITSWDDGNTATWEGNMYLIDSTQDLNTSLDSELDISTEEPPTVNWAQGDMVGDTGDGGDNDDYPLMISNDAAKSLLRFSPPNAFVRASTHLSNNPPVDGLSGGFPLLVGQNACSCGTPILAKCFLKAGWDNGWAFCGSAIAFCRFSGASYWGCLGGSCGGAVGAYTLVEARGHWNRCVRH